MAIFDGPYIPGCVGPALHRLLACSLLDDIDTSDHRYRVMTAIGNPNNYVGDKRIWWRCPRNPHRTDHYFISTNPGQFSETAPRDPDALIRDCPEIASLAGLTDEIAQLLKAGDPYQSALADPRIRNLVSTARHIKEGQYPALLAGAVRRFSTASQHARLGEREEYQQSIATLYTECLFGFAMPNLQFSQCMLLLQLQTMTGNWIEQDCYSAPRGFLSGYFNLLSSSNYAQLVGALAKIGNTNYREGRAAVARSLDAGYLVEQQRELMQAAHSYMIAVQVAGLARDLKADFGLKYLLVNADEGFACAHCGLFYGLNGLLYNIDLYAKRVATILEAGGEWSAAKEKHGLSSHVFPIFPRYLTDVILGRALTCKVNPRFEEGLCKLLSLQGDLANQTSWESVFEGSYLDHCLLNAYRVSGNDAEARIYAYRIAGKMVLEVALAKPAS